MPVTSFYDWLHSRTVKGGKSSRAVQKHPHAQPKPAILRRKTDTDKA